MTFDDCLAWATRDVPARLADAFARERARRAGLGDDVETMVAAAESLSLRGGKRLRAALVGAGALVFGGSLAEALSFATAMELVQTYLLIHDDWMDQDAERRGGPSAHVMLSRSRTPHLAASSAVLSGDLASAMALAELAAAPLPAPRIVRAVARLSDTLADVIAGQELDLSTRAIDVAAMHALKTSAYTTTGPLLLGAAAAGADGAAEATIRAYGRPLGVAFQIEDDLLGTFGTAEETGKPVGADLRAGKKTAVLAEAERTLSPDAMATVRAALRDDASDDAVRVATETLSAVRPALEARRDALRTEAVRAVEPLGARGEILVDAAARIGGRRLK